MTRRWDRSHRDSQGPGPEVVGVDQASSSDEAVGGGGCSRSPAWGSGRRCWIFPRAEEERVGTATELACNQTAACTSDYCKCTAQASSITLRSERPLLTLATGSSLACRSNAHRAALGHLPGAELGRPNCPYCMPGGGPPGGGGTTCHSAPSCWVAPQNE